ncbi:MAG: hypothetical protein MPW15_14365 [Candidatus Manganitrophus sp.]|nr:hypothetical protein [Candidatus Manganitrophus sp.]
MRYHSLSSAEQPAYQTFSGDFYTHNPATLAPWTWSDINNMMGVVNHVTNANGLRVTQVYLSINYISPVALSYSPDTGFGSTSGVFPKGGGASTPFTYKVVYTNLNNNAPTSIKVHIDGDGGQDMIRDPNAEHPEFRDGDFENGEQYTYMAASLSSGQHTYYFAASDGSDSTQKPATGTLAGPGVQIPAGTDTILPSGENELTIGDWGFNGADATTALDPPTSPDGNTSYADLDASQKGEVLYIDMDDTALTGAITSVQVTAVMCSPSTSLANVRIGLRLNGTDYVGTAFSVADSSSCGTYTTYTPDQRPLQNQPRYGKKVDLGRYQ